MAVIGTANELRARYGAPTARSLRKQLDHLDVHCRRFIELSPFCVLATGSSATGLDATPRGGPPGFARVLDEHTLLLPDWPGNNRLDSLENLLTTPQIGISVPRPGGRRDAAHQRPRPDPRRRRPARSFSEGRPATVLAVTVDEAYLHCAKALMRSRLWDPAMHVERSQLPTAGQMLRDHVGSADPAEPQEAMVARYEKVLYELEEEPP